MMKTIFYTLAALPLMFVSCIDDKGNYDYVTAEGIMPEIREFLYGEDGGNYYGVTQGDSLKIIPFIYNVVNGDTIEVADDDRFSYTWYVWDELTAPPQRDTMATTRDLKIKVVLEASSYKIYCQVKDKAKNIFTTTWAKIRVNVIPISNGWYVLKSIDGETDFDYVSRAEGAAMTENILHISGRGRAQGNPLTMLFLSRYFHEFVDEETGKVTTAYQSAFMLLTDKDLVAYRASDILPLKHFDEMFYETPAVKAPQWLAALSSGVYCINDGKISVIYSMSAGIGKFVPQLYMNTENYYLHPDILTHNSECAMVFDTRSSSFLYSGSAATSLQHFFYNNETVAANLTDYKLLRILSRNPEASSYTVSTAYAIVENLYPGASTKYSLLSLAMPRNSSGSPLTGAVVDIPANSGLPTATVMAAPRTASCIYFANGDNVLKAFSETSLSDRVMYTFDSNETVSFIWNNLRGRANGETANSDYLAVLTNNVSANRWKLYLFKILNSSINIEAEPNHVYSGEGKGVSVIYR